MNNIIKVDFDDFMNITMNGLDINIETSKRTVYIKDLLWVLKEAELEIVFYETSGKDTFDVFLQKSLTINIEILFLYWLQEANLRYILIDSNSKEAKEKLKHLFSLFQRDFGNEIKLFKIHEEKNEKIKLAKMRLLSCCYDMDLFEKEELKRLLNLKVVLL